MGYTIWPDGAIGEVLQEVYRERHRQDELKREGKFKWNCADSTRRTDDGETLAITLPEKLAVLAEEFGEVSREVTEAIIASDKGELMKSPAGKERLVRLRKELVETAAVCVAWAESLS